MNSRYRLLAIAVLLTMGVPGWAATPFSDAAQDLGSRIASLTGPGTASLTIKNTSSIPNDQLVGIRRAIEAQLKSGGVRVRETEVTSEVMVTLSENARAFVWIAEVKQGVETRVALIEVPRTSAKSAASTAPAITLKKTAILSQTGPILDALTLSGSRLAVLGPEAIGLYDQIEGKWHLMQSFPIVRAVPFPRDLRGRLVPNADHVFDAYLPGTVCAADAKATMVECHASDDPWPMGEQSAFFNSGRNFFTGLMRPGFSKPIPAFYSVAAIQREKYTLWVFAGADNQVRSWDGVNLRTMGATTRDWGSDLVAVRSSCGAGTQLLVSAAGDDSAADSLRAFEIADREPVAVAAPLPFDSPITALWPAADRASAVTVVHNIHQGTFDAYSVSVSCGQ